MKSTIRGMFMLGRGKREGINEFSNSSDSVLSALAPWIALALAVNLLPILMMRFKDMHAVSISISMFLVKICCLLVTVGIIHFFASLWNSEANWKRTTVAILWCFWVPILDFFLFFIIVGLFFAGLPNIFMALFGLASVLYMAYSIWLSWFVVKVGLQTTTSRSVMIIVSLILASMVIYSIFVSCNYSYMVQAAHELQQQIEQAKPAQ
ncbi:unnamed protein product [Commensalibacter communis]|uniref:hypothetical protein n=1 Tax=Commensalibacter communis TaxID=2972786 RepID=UPI0022FF968A|nr:hypothetical protein [Commensalibacter communis]CAI3947675.1 unnamed protein product [Commensalibacter communis]CAI3949004.1 unnamed protein product [Commensalibacter communis]